MDHSVSRNQSWRPKAMAALVATLLLTPLLSAPVAAANPTIQVNISGDATDANPSDGVCETAAGNGVCTLRAAVMEANERAGADTIQLSASTYPLKIPALLSESDAAIGDLNVFEDLTIIGKGLGATTVEASESGWQDATSRVFATSGADPVALHLASMTIRNGNSGVQQGGGISLTNSTHRLFLDHVVMQDNHSPSNSGGAIAGGGAITIAHSWIRTNVAQQAGAIETGGTLTISDSKFDANEAAGNAAAIRMGGQAVGSITRSEFIGNIPGPNGQPTIQVGRGGPTDTTNLTITNSTFADNKGGYTLVTSGVGAQGVLKNNTFVGNSGTNLVGSFSLRNTIVADSGGTNCGGNVTSLGHNLFDDATCDNQTSDLQADPKLGPWVLDFTLARPPLAGSPAIDAGANCPTTDQHGAARPLDGDTDGKAVCDIGAIEAPKGTTPPTPSTYVPIAPVRLLDTRTNLGLSGQFTANTARSVLIAGRGGIPNGAVAITANLTVVGQQGAGYLSVTPTLNNNPSTSALNFPLGDVRANNITSPLGSGKLSIVYKAAAGKKTHVVLDVTGYFLENSTGATYHALTPARLLDTRVANGLNGAFAAHTVRDFDVAGRGGVPANARAVTGNLTVVGQKAAGYVTLGPSLADNPKTSTINFPLGDTRANGITVRLAADGHLDAIYVAPLGKTAHLVFDVTGYYLEDLSGSKFYPLTPGRVLDTRVSNGLSGSFKSDIARALKIEGRVGVPAAADAVTGNLSVVGQTDDGYVSMTKALDNTPDTSALNFPIGDVRANGVTGPLSNSGTVGLVFKASAGKTTNLILDITGYFAP
jgi:CSLREA domain-containing protein